MALHIYECKNGHRIQFNESINADQSGRLCAGRGPRGCGEPLVLSAAVPTGTPILKRGCGGFCSPNRDV
jgi:hypothetical protein